MPNNAYKTSKTLPMIIALLACIIAFSACTSGKQDKMSKADSIRINNLRQLGDSIMKLSPTVLPTINKGLKEAPDSISFYEYKLKLAQYYWLSETPERADTILQQIYAFAEKEKEKFKDHPQRLNTLLASAYSCEGARLHNFHKDSKATIKLYKKSYDLLQNSESKFDLPKTCANMGDAYIQTNDIPEAANWYRRALFLVDSLQLPAKENITLYMGLAYIYLSLHDFKTAQYYYDQTEKYFKQMTPSMQSYHLCNLGNFYYYTHQYNKALSTYQRMKQNLQAHNLTGTFDMYLCNINLADVYLNLDSLDRAKEMLDVTEPFFKKVNAPAGMYYCNTIRMGIATKQGNTREVARVLNSENDKADMPYTMVNIRNGYLRRYYEQTGNYRQAYNSVLDNIQYNDSLEHNRSNMRAAEIMSRFKSDTLQLHHDLEMEHKNAIIQKAHTWTSIAISTVLVLVLLIIIWVMYVRRKQMEQRLNVMNLKLDIVRNRISPHFVFNVLNNKIINSGEQEATELMALTRLIRSNLDMSCTPSVALKDELDFVEQYIKVESFILGNDFCFDISIGEGVDVQTTRIPSMFIQILTENAIVHALKGKEGAKILNISITQDDANTIVAVSDNGAGFRATALHKKRTGLGMISQTIAVINEYNKQKIRFNIHNNENHDGNITGCVATLKIPKYINYK